jgi:hypothetical protein
MIRILAWNDKDLDSVRFADGFKNEIYIDSDFSLPAYEIENEGFEDGDKNEILEFQKWKKKQQIKLIAYEDVADFISMLPLFDNVQIGYHNENLITIKDIEIETDIIDLVYLEISIKFTKETIVKRVSDSNMTSS